VLCHVTQPPAAGVCASPSVPGLGPELLAPEWANGIEGSGVMAWSHAALGKWGGVGTVDSEEEEEEEEFIRIQRIL